MIETVLSIFNKGNIKNQENAIRDAGRIVDSYTLEKQLKMSYNKKAYISEDSFDLDLIIPQIESKPVFNKNISNEIIISILRIIQANHPDSVNEFDTILITRDQSPVFCFFNKSKLRKDGSRREIQEFRKASNEEESESEEDNEEFDSLFVQLDHLLNENKEIFFECIGRLDEYSYHLDLSQYICTDNNYLNKYTLSGLALTVAAITFIYYHNRNN